MLQAFGSFFVFPSKNSSFTRSSSVFLLQAPPKTQKKRGHLNKIVQPQKEAAPDKNLICNKIILCYNRTTFQPLFVFWEPYPVRQRTFPSYLCRKNTIT